MIALCVLSSSQAWAQTQTTVTVLVRSETVAVEDALVTAGDRTARTDGDGRALLQVAPGVITLAVTKPGFFDVVQTVTVGESDLDLDVELVPTPEVEEEVVVVATTRTGRRVEDQPTRVEVLGREEIEEKMLMTPGDIVMMLNEMGGLRVQTTSPSIGAGSVRVQGMKGRYTRFLGDGLPLFGQQVGGLGLLQIPPMDLGQVEVIKGVASAMYGAGAMGGVVNLLTRRPGDELATDLLVNQSTLGGTDAVAFVSTPIADRWRMSMLAGGHRQIRNDRNDDGWADVAGYDLGMLGMGVVALGMSASAQSNPPEPLRNKAAIERALAAWRDGTGSPYDLLADDAVWTIVGRSLASRTYDSRQAFMRDVIRPFNARMSSGLKPEVRHLYADGDTVIAFFDARGVARDGKPYENTYAWFLTMRDGRIVRAFAFYDSVGFNELWTRVSPDVPK